MTILFLTRRFYPQVGGVEKHVMEIGSRLVKKGHRVIVVTEALAGASLQLAPKRSGADYKSTPAEIEGIEIYRISVGNDNWFKKLRIWKAIWSLREVVKTADIIHCHDVFFWYLPFRFLYPTKKVYTTFHGYESFPIRKKAIFMRKISEKISYGNICIGDFIRKWYGTKPDYVSYGAVDKVTHEANPTKRAKKHSALFIGRLDDQTGILTYVKVFELVKKKFPNFELLVVGDGPYRKQINKKVKVLGFQNNPEKYFYQYHFAFVSRYLSILEAFAAKKLVFAVFDNPVKEDYLRMAPFAPFIVIEKNPEKLAERIEYYLSHPDEEEIMISNAFRWIKKQRWNEIVLIYEKLWEIH